MTSSNDSHKQAIYLRVSRKDLDEEKQNTAILKRYNLQNSITFREQESAYDEEKQEKRTEFQRMKNGISEGVITEVYIFSIERLERNIVRLFEFYFFCEAHNCKIYSVMQDIPNKVHEEKPQETFLRYIHVLLFGFKGQEESYTTSYRTKSAVEVTNNNTYSYKGNKWGKKFTNLEGKKVDVDQEQLEALQKHIKKDIAKYEKLKYKGYYALIIENVAKKFNIKISKAYISVLRK